MKTASTRTQAEQFMLPLDQPSGITTSPSATEPAEPSDLPFPPAPVPPAGPEEAPTVVPPDSVPEDETDDHAGPIEDGKSSNGEQVPSPNEPQDDRTDAIPRGHDANKILESTTTATEPVKTFLMAHERHENHEAPQWARAKSIRQSRGITAPQLARYAEEGLIRTSHIRRPGQTRGVRLFHLGDIDQLILSSVEQRPTQTTDNAHPGDTPGI